MKAQRLLDELRRRRARRRERIVPSSDWGQDFQPVTWERETRAFYLWISGPTGRS
jgi:hypothetical protein